VSEHFCATLSLIAPGSASDCPACKGELDAEQVKARRRDILNGGAAQHYEIVRARRLAHALVLYK